MALEKQAAGIKITQPDAETIVVSEGGGVARVLGMIILVGGSLLVWKACGKTLDVTTLIFGALLAVFGLALVTQRYMMTLDRRQGTWSYGGDVFLVIPFKSDGSLRDVGPVRITRLARNPSEHNRGAPIITHPVSVEGERIDGSKAELRFGQNWSLDEAHELAAALAEFLDRPVQDDSAEEAQGDDS